MTPLQRPTQFGDNLYHDDPEQRPLAERCLLGFGSTQGPPMMPVLYDNHKKIIQTSTHVMILVEMIHRAWAPPAATCT